MAAGWFVPGNSPPKDWRARWTACLRRVRRKRISRPRKRTGLRTALRNSTIACFHFARTWSTCICMKNVPVPAHIERRFAPTALMLGNIVTGCSVLAPAGMLSELSSGLDVSIRDAGLLIPFGAVMLCIGSPLTAWLTSRIERRSLLTTTLAVLALTNAVSAFAPDYATLLVVRLVMLSVGALYTPQAAGTAALIVAPEKRGSTIAFIFVGWSLAAAVGLPLITFVASRYGWRSSYCGIRLLRFFRLLIFAWVVSGLVEWVAGCL